MVIFYCYSPGYDGLLLMVIFCCYSPGYGGEQIPTLYEAIELCEKLDLIMFLEIKGQSDKVGIVMGRLFRVYVVWVCGEVDDKGM